MKILVTGGAGYIGSIAAQLLIEAGHDVIVLDNLSRGRRELIPEKAHFIQANVAQVGNVITHDDHIDAVLHFAAFSAAGEAADHPEMYWKNNTVESLQLLDTLRKLGIKKLIFSSTCFVYGNPAVSSIDEAITPNPINPYGMSKLAVDMAIASECAAHGLGAISFRYFNVGGAYKSFGERHTNETRIIPLALAAADKGKPFYLYGDDYPTPDGTCVRDYIHVVDLVEAHLLALRTVALGKHEIYNLGNGRGFSNREIIESVEAVTGRRLDVRIVQRRSGDPATLVASSAKALKELGWQPKRQSLENIIGDAWKFYTQPICTEQINNRGAK